MTPVGGSNPDLCRACGSEQPTGFYSVHTVPTQTCVLLDDADAALQYPTGDVLLAVCHRCGFIQNTRFDPDKVDYSVPTEESQAYSPRFRAFSDSLAKELWSRHGLADRSVLEIGCGKGDFLAGLVDLGVGSAIGIDPGFLPNRGAGGDGKLRFIRDWYDDRYTGLSADLIVARHVLEHIPDVLRFTSLMAESARRTPGSALFVEVPDTVRVLDEGAFWDIYYEHCSYFAPVSLEGTLRRAGLTPTDLRLGFDDQYLLAEGVPTPSGEEPAPGGDVGDLLERVRSFASKAEAARDRWSHRFSRLSAGGGRVALWGGGSKAVAFLASVETAGTAIDVIDINPHKHHKYLPGSGIQVQPPDALAEAPPELVVVMNPVYRQEITDSLREMGLATRVMTVTD